MFRKGVSALIINEKKDFLLVNLKSFEEKFFAIPGGGVEQGETLEDAVYREIYEELGISQNNLQIIGQSDIPLRFKFKEIKLNRDGVEYEGSERYFFGLKFIGNDSDIKLQEDEIRFYKWVSFENLKDYLLFDNQLVETTEKIKEVFPNFEKIDGSTKNLHTQYLGKEVRVVMDRPLRSNHPKHGFRYEVNYGFIPDTKAPDGEEIDAYVLGIDYPVESFEGKCVAIIHRTDDNDDKLVVIPKDMKDISDDEIKKQTNFQEQFFKSVIIRQ